MQYYNNYNNFGANGEYFNRLAAAKKREKHAMFVNCSKLGALLLLYELFNAVFIRVYYIIVYAVDSGAVTFDYRVAVKYLRGREELVSSSLFSMAGNIFVVVVSVVLLMLIARFVMKIDFHEMMKPQKRHVGQAAKWFPLCMTLNVAVNIVISVFTSYMEQAGITVPESDFSISSAGALTLAAQFAYVIVIGPIVEELIYRGVILTLLKPYGKFMAVFFSALIFGLMHGNIAQAASAFASALIYGIIAVRCNSIIPTIMIHIANNTIASYSDFADVCGWAYTTEIYAAIEIVIILFGLYVLFTSGRQLRFENDNNYALTSGQRYAAVFTNVFMLIYFAYIIWTFIRSFIIANM